MTQADIEQKIQNAIDKLHCSYEEAKEMVYDDIETDHMTVSEINAELTPEQKARIKKAKNVGTRKAPTVYKFEKKTKKEDAEKKDIMRFIFEKISEKVTDAVLVNAEGQIDFTIGTNSYSLKLTKHRPPKEK